jgi:predicted Zn-dependent protease with MMP-like domain
MTTNDRGQDAHAGWRHSRAPDSHLLEILAHEAFATLPQRFRVLCKDLLIRIEEFPEDEVLADMELDSPFDILGLYQGVDLTKKSVADAEPGIDVIFLYRRPLLDYWAESGERLNHLITHVLIHEIGHHFGLSDEDMERIEQEALP